MGWAGLERDEGERTVYVRPGHHLVGRRVNHGPFSAARFRKKNLEFLNNKKNLEML